MLLLAALRQLDRLQVVFSIKCEPLRAEGGLRIVEPAQAEEASGNTEAAPSKKAQVVPTLYAPEGATLAQIMAATGWQKHSVRGFISGAVGKKMGLTVVSSKTEDGERVYRIQR